MFRVPSICICAAISFFLLNNCELSNPARGQVTAVRSLDGQGNNVAHPNWGRAGTDLTRVAANSYSDGIGAVITSRPNARLVSDIVHAQVAMRSDPRGLSEFAWVWGQFIDHDIDHTMLISTADHADVVIPAGDSTFTPGQVLVMTRSQFEGGATTPREQLNNISAFLDGSMVYGGRATEGDGLARANWLRSFSGGQLRTSVENGEEFLPRRGSDAAPVMSGAVADPTQLFVAGDVRANENSALLSMHTLFMREHNAVAAQIATARPALSDEQLYQATRKVIGAEIQAITYDEFLPAMGIELAPYAGYRADVDPSVRNEFSAAAYRTSHSQVNGVTLRLNADGSPHVANNIALQDSFFNPNLVVQSGIAPILRGLGAQVQEAMDAGVQDGLRNMLFGPPTAGPIANGSDVAALDIQRGRDHGLADYNTVRIAYGLSAVNSFVEITSSLALQASLQSLYGSSVNSLDLWTGLVAEENLPGASLGELNMAIWKDQFARLRDGDRFFYLHDPDFLPGGFLDSIGFGADVIGQLDLANLIAARSGAIVGLGGNAFSAVPEPNSFLFPAVCMLFAFTMEDRSRQYSIQRTRRPTVE